MDISINNQCKDKCKVDVSVVNNDSITIVIRNRNKEKILADVKVGSTIIIGEREYVVLEHSAGTTAVITKESVKAMAFGKDGDYTKSDVRTYCNGEFYNELCNAVGKDNIIPHGVSLMADDGTGKRKIMQDNVSILTTDLYRRYRAFLPSYGDWWWTATRVSDDDSIGCSHFVRCVNSIGILCWDGCGFSYGIRPFCILNSSLMVNVKGDE